MDVDVLERLWRSWGERGVGLSAAEWGRATRLPGWTVQDLFAHVAPDPKVLHFFRGPLVAEPVIAGGAELLRALHAPGGVTRTRADEIAAGARQAAAVGTEVLSRYFTDTGAEAIGVLRAADPALGRHYPQVGSVSVGAIVEAAIVEATVHLLDLIAAVGGTDVPEDGLRRTVQILAAVPDPVVFIESVTGRGEGTPTPILR
ncbi:maleylpyruvate isomerase N-terminal domain-containing protein [Nocardia sp. alder85J]|uniref:maleylpyruvate isomerase N-terminal domain-containing protein n=1 Tax=Nocardia sp. alder85J TaxID=2862949 RepID=UPI001CD6D69E|nr:maleylpyruvate isomerase N-terminal domain-containing protein [Nocardia sp. alder85J]MCX4093149.1 maleylpyruvate isomerase N-terminal domain-containing protein [Nocardia sp. alder85J]